MFKVDIFSSLFFPDFCVGCGAPAKLFCPRCSQKLSPVVKQQCFYCHRPAPYGLTHPGCQKRERLFGVFSLFWYRFPTTSLIKKSKYQPGELILKNFLYSINPAVWWPLCDFLKTLPGCVLVPIPLYKNDLQRRGFNQAKTIADFIGKLSHKEVSNFLLKTKPTTQQSTLKDEARKLNLKKAYQAIKQNSQTVVLIDDVVTTGATLTEAAKTLYAAGAAKVYGLTLFKAR